MDIFTLDLEFQGISEINASYLVVGPGGPVLVESGPASTLPTLRRKLAKYGFLTGDVKHVLLTHIHLDHAGAAGHLAQEGAQLYVHHVGAPHIVDPSRLLASASRIYGDRMDALWGNTIPAAAERVTAVADGDIIDAAGLQFSALDTPGHAWHHHTYRLGSIAFTGDAGGIRIPGKHLVDLPAPPPEFKLEVWHRTIDRLLAEEFTAIYPTHFGRVDNVTKQLNDTKALLQEASSFVRTCLEQGLNRDAIVEAYTGHMVERAHNAGLDDEIIGRYEVVNPLYMSVDGIMRYWQRKLAKQEP